MTSRLPALLVVACAAGAVLVSVPARADIIIGQSAPLTGGNAELGNDIRNGTLAYFKKINEAGGVNGSKISLLTLDDKNEAKLSGENAKQLIQKDGAVA